MVKRILLVVIFLFVTCMAFAAPDMKTFEFGPQKYQISEKAPDFMKWEFTLEKKMELTGLPTPCSAFLFVGGSPDSSVKVMLLVFKEPGGIYLVGLLVKYEATGQMDCYEDERYFSGGPPSFILTKKPESGDVLILIEMKKIQFGKKEI